MTEAEALRVLGLESRAGIDAAWKVESVRGAFSAQMRMLRGARGDAGSARDRLRVDRALRLTLMARDRLLPPDSPALALTQELPEIEQPRRFLPALAVLLIGVSMVVLGLLPVAGPVPVDAQQDELPRAEAAVGKERVSRALLENVRVTLLARWQQLPAFRLPSATDLEGMALPPLPAGWRWQGQRDGAFAAIDSDRQDWLLAAPLLENDSLYWACFSARPGRPGCHVLTGDRIIERRLPRGQVGARLLAEALARLPESQRQDGWSPERWYRQALAMADFVVSDDATSSCLDTLLAPAAESGAYCETVSTEPGPVERIESTVLSVALFVAWRVAGGADAVHRQQRWPCALRTIASACSGAVMFAAKVEQGSHSRGIG